MKYFAAAALAALSLAAHAAEPVRSIDTATIEALLKERVETFRKTPSIVVGLIDEGGERVIALGTVGAGGAKVNADTLYEIGSITKTFTALLLAEAAAKGEIKRNDTLGSILPIPGNSDTAVAARAITLESLATHHSGLPRLPCNMNPFDAANPYADYRAADLLKFLAADCWKPKANAEYDYSNVGGGLLGYALAEKARTSYGELLQTRVLAPLSMTRTYLTVPDKELPQLAMPHSAEGKPTKVWDFDVLAPAGGLKSSMRDMLTFLRAHLQPDKTLLGRAATLATQPRAKARVPNTQIGMAWHITQAGAQTIVWHNGGTFGSASFIGFDPAARRGVVVLTNAAYSVDDLGLHLLVPGAPLRALR